MSASEDQLTKQINNMKLLASRRIDDLLEPRKPTQHELKPYPIIRNIFNWLKR